MVTVGTAPVRMVVADDAPESRALVRAMLEYVDGVDVVGMAANGQQAVDLVDETHPDLILLDIAMPVMDGLEAAAAIRAKSPEVKIAMYSAYNRGRMGPAAMAAGADVYVEKSATLDELLDQIHRLFPDRAVPTPQPFGHGSRRSANASKARTPGEQRYRLLLDALEEGVLTIDATGLVTEANFVATQILKTPVSRMLGRSLAELGLSSPGPTVEIIEDAMRAERPVSNVDYVLTRPDGSTGRLLINVRPLHDPANLTVHETLVSFVDLSAQRQAELELRESEERFRAAIESMKEAFFLMRARRDAEGMISDFDYITVNTEACRVAGCSQAELTGRGLLEQFAEVGQDGRLDRYRDVVETGVPYHSMFDYHVGGTPGTLEVSVTKAGDGCLMIGSDVSDRLHAQQELADSERRYRRMLETTHEGVVIVDAEARITYANPQLAAMSGFSVEELVGSPVWTFLSSESHADVETGIEDRRSGKAGVYQARIRRKDGSKIWILISASPVTDSSGQYAGSLAMISDIDDRIRAEDQLRHERDLNDAMLDVAGALVAVADANWCFVRFNRLAEELTGYSEADVLGRSYQFMVPPEERASVAATLDPVRSSDHPITLENHWMTKDGDLRLIRWTATGLFDADARLTHVVAVGLDVTDERQVEEQLAQRAEERLKHDQELTAAHAQVQSRAEQLERSNRDLEAFASALSHDLREPLRTTADFIHLIEDRYASDLPEPAQELFGYVIDGTQRMSDRITAILNYARSGASAAPPHPVDSAAAAATAAADSGAILTETGAQLCIGPLPTVSADALQLQRVFQNLLTNAAKYQQHGVAPHIEISAEPLAEHWQFTVADNGPGVPEAMRERIFRMFVRGATGDEDGGTGMGLALCRRIVESYGGRIWIEDNPGGGSRFCFTFPKPLS